MWIMSRYGFFSIVEHFNKQDVLIRTRDKKHLDNIVTKWPTIFENCGGVQRSLLADYEYRVVLSATKAHDLYHCLIKDVDYPNFKDDCHNNKYVDETYLSILYKVYTVFVNTYERIKRNGQRANPNVQHQANRGSLGRGKASSSFSGKRKKKGSSRKQKATIKAGEQSRS